MSADAGDGEGEVDEEEEAAEEEEEKSVEGYKTTPRGEWIRIRPDPDPDLDPDLEQIAMCARNKSHSWTLKTSNYPSVHRHT